MLLPCAPKTGITKEPPGIDLRSLTLVSRKGFLSAAFMSLEAWYLINIHCPCRTRQVGVRSAEKFLLEKQEHIPLNFSRGRLAERVN